MRDGGNLRNLLFPREPLAIKHSCARTRHQHDFISETSLRARGLPALARRLQFVLPVIVLCFLAEYCPASRASIHSYSVEVAPSTNSIRWISDSKIALRAIAVREDGRPTQYPWARVGKLAILDLVANHIEWGDEFTGELCVNGEHIAYSTAEEVISPGKREQRFWISRGKIGQITKREVKREDLYSSRNDFEYSCRQVADLPPQPSVSPDVLIKRLLPEHGFVTFATAPGKPASPLYPLALYPKESQARSVPLGELRGADLSWRWPYSEFKNAYWLTEVIRVVPPRPTPATPRFRSWWLHPDGRTEIAIEFDLNATFDGSYSWVPAIPFRNGFLAIQDRTRTGRKPSTGNIGNSGLYLFDPKGKHKKLLSGTVQSVAVSADGCKVAAGVDDRLHDGASERLMLRILNACELK